MRISIFVGGVSFLAFRYVCIASLVAAFSSPSPRLSLGTQRAAWTCLTKARLNFPGSSAVPFVAA